MNKPLLSTALFLLALLPFSCGVLLEEDLSKLKIELLAPNDGYSSNQELQELVWATDEVIDSFRLEVVQDSFSAISTYILDSTILGNSHRLTLSPGHYQWRVRGINGSSSTDYETFNLTIEPDSSLSHQSLYLIQPEDLASFNTDSILFLWEGLSLAQSYRLQVASHPSFNSQLMLIDQQISQDYYLLQQQLGTGTFYWRLRAIRQHLDSTAWSATLSFSLNIAPELTQPASASQINSLPANFSWRSASQHQRDSIYFYYENESSPFLIRASQTANFNLLANDTIGKGAGNYYWKVRAVGVNGQLSSYSPLWQVMIN